MLDAGGLVVLFPEGTSSDGRHVLPFKSSLLESVTRLNHPVTVAFMNYSLPDGDVHEDVCYWGAMTLAPHLIKLFSKNGIQAHVAFTQLERNAHSRKELARDLHSHVVRLKDSASEAALA